jgi:hypothetical protein
LRAKLREIGASPCPTCEALASKSEPRACGVRLVPDHNLPSAGDHDFIPLRIARELIGYPYFNLGVAIVTTVALFLMSRLR